MQMRTHGTTVPTKRLISINLIDNKISPSQGGKIHTNINCFFYPCSYARRKKLKKGSIIVHTLLWRE